MVREGKVVRSRTNYILGTDRSIFRNVSAQDPRHNTDHFMVVGCLRSAPEREYARYIKVRRKIPCRPPMEPTRGDGILETLRRAVPKPHEREKHKNAWISEETWRLNDERVSARRGMRVQVRIQRLGRAIRASLQGDRKWRVETARTDVEALLGKDTPPLHLAGPPLAVPPHLSPRPPPSVSCLPLGLPVWRGPVSESSLAPPSP